MDKNIALILVWKSDRTGRFLRKYGPVFCLIMIALMLGFGVIIPPMHFTLVVIGPSIALHIITGIRPTKARLYCHNCNLITFHPLPKKIDNRIPRVTE
ncbi:hypothetical protein N9A74_07795 [Akkermansiaceae bacterium]|nr:hypothetical protein [Akkermansiaceae bacterium]